MAGPSSTWAEHDASVDVEVTGRRLGAPQWQPTTGPMRGQHAYRRRGGDLVVVWSVGDHPDDSGDWWLHVSCSAKAAIPTHEHMAEVKAVFVGPDRWAYAVWPPADRHINLHPRALHLWAPLDNQPRLPDFGRHGTI